VNPFTAKAAFIWYWNRKVPSARPHPAFFFAKLSPLSTPDAAAFSTLASAGKLASTPVASWSASSPSPTAKDAEDGGASSGGTVPFKDYENGNFTSYGNKGGGGADQFAFYSRGKSNPVDTFKRYGKGWLAGPERLLHELRGGEQHHIGTSSFTSYTEAAGHSGVMTGSEAGAKQRSSGRMFKWCVVRFGPRSRVLNMQGQNGLRPSWMLSCVGGVNISRPVTRERYRKVCKNYCFLLTSVPLLLCFPCSSFCFFSSFPIQFPSGLNRPLTIGIRHHRS
jgi:hypothetical protein